MWQKKGAKNFSMSQKLKRVGKGKLHSVGDQCADDYLVVCVALHTGLI